MKAKSSKASEFVEVTFDSKMKISLTTTHLSGDPSRDGTEDSVELAESVELEDSVELSESVEF